MPLENSFGRVRASSISAVSMTSQDPSGRRCTGPRSRSSANAGHGSRRVAGSSGSKAGGAPPLGPPPLPRRTGRRSSRRRALRQVVVAGASLRDTVTTSTLAPIVRAVCRRGSARLACAPISTAVTRPPSSAAAAASPRKYGLSTIHAQNRASKHASDRASRAQDARKHGRSTGRGPTSPRSRSSRCRIPVLRRVWCGYGDGVSLTIVSRDPMCALAASASRAELSSIDVRGLVVPRRWRSTGAVSASASASSAGAATRKSTQSSLSTCTTPATEHTTVTVSSSVRPPAA